jgi:hypothetical protein
MEADDEEEHDEDEEDEDEEESDFSLVLLLRNIRLVAFWLGAIGYRPFLDVLSFVSAAYSG